MRSVTLLALVTLFACTPPSRGDGRGGRNTPVGDAGDSTDGGEEELDGGFLPDGGEEESDGGEQEADGGEDESDGGDPTNRAPSATVAAPSGGGGDIVLRALLFDSDADLLSITLEYAVGPSGNFLPATTPSPLSNLTSGPSGVEHAFTWKSAVDLPETNTTVFLRVTPRDPWVASTPVVTDGFVVDNRRPNTAPVLRWDVVPSSVRGDASFAFSALDAEADPVTVSFEYRVGAGAWQTPTYATEPPATVNAMAGGVQANFVWASVADVPANAPQVFFRGRLDDGRTRSAWEETAAFAVNNAPVTRTPGVRIVEVNVGNYVWFDLTNTGASTVDLSGWNIRWTGSNPSTTLTLPASDSRLSLAPGATVTVSDAPEGSMPGTIQVGFIYWNHGAPGSLALSDAQETPVDFVRWGGSTEPAPAPLTWTEPVTHQLLQETTSLVRKPGADTLSSADFCLALAMRGAGEGSCVSGPPAGTRVRLTELSAGADVPMPSNPSDAPDWVELVNAGSVAVDLKGWSVLTKDAAKVNVVALPSVVVPAGGRFVVREGTGTSTSTMHYTGDGTMQLTNAGVTKLLAPNGEPVDYVQYGGITDSTPPLGWPAGQATPGPVGRSTISRVSETFSGTGDAAPEKWCATVPSPGARASACKSAPNTTGLRVNEINSVPLLSFGSSAIELSNAGASAIELAEVTLIVSGTPFSLSEVVLSPGERHVIKDCGVLSPSGCKDLGYLNGAPTIGFVELTDSVGNSIDFVRWGGSAATPGGHGGQWTETTVLAPSGIPDKGSLGRRSGASDTNASVDWCLQAGSIGQPNTACN